MKSREEIQQLAKDFADDAHGSPTATFLEKGYIIGYTQCQEDMAKELEELREAIRKNTWYDEDGWAQVNLYGIDNNLLNKQD